MTRRSRIYDKARYVSPDSAWPRHPKVAKNADASAEEGAGQAQDLASQLPAGKDFAPGGQSSGDDPAHAQGGDLGWRWRRASPIPPSAALFGMGLAAPTPALSAEGYHVILLRDVRAEHVRALREVKGDRQGTAGKPSASVPSNEVAGKLTDAVNADPSSLENVAQETRVGDPQDRFITRRGGEGIANWRW